MPSANGFVVATKRFGALKAIYLDHIGYEDEVGKCIATKTISQSHRSLLGDLVSSECVASDASGFGLDGALRTLADKFGVRIDLDQEKLLFCSEFSRSISVECLEFKNPFQNSSVNYSRPQPANSHLSEVSGPLIILVPIDKLDRFLQNCCSAGYADAHVIGAWSQK